MRRGDVEGESGGESGSRAQREKDNAGIRRGRACSREEGVMEVVGKRKPPQQREGPPSLF